MVAMAHRVLSRLLVGAMLVGASLTLVANGGYDRHPDSGLAWIICPPPSGDGVVGQDVAPDSKTGDPGC
jgi:hypothetical protein